MQSLRVLRLQPDTTGWPSFLPCFARFHAFYPLASFFLLSFVGENWTLARKSWPKHVAPSEEKKKEERGINDFSLLFRERCKDRKRREGRGEADRLISMKVKMLSLSLSLPFCMRVKGEGGSERASERARQQGRISENARTECGEISKKSVDSFVRLRGMLIVRHRC